MKRILILLSLFLTSIIAYPQAIKNVNKWIEKGEKAEKKGAVEKAIQYYNWIIEAYNECDSTDNKLGDTFSALASIYSDLGDKSKAIEYENNALEVRRIVFGENHSDYTASLNNLFVYYSDLGNYSKASEYCTKAEEIDKIVLGENHPDYACTLFNCAKSYFDLGNYSKAVEYMAKAVEIHKVVSGENSSDYAKSLAGIALIYSKLGDYSKAIEYEKQAMGIRKTVLGENHPDYAESLSGLAVFYNLLGDYSKAIEYEKRAMEIRKTVLGESNSIYATSLSNLSHFYGNLGDNYKAIEYEQQALEIRKSILGENHPDYVTSLCNLATSYSDFGDFSKSAEYFIKALEVAKKALGEKHPNYAALLNNYAVFCSDLGDYSKALKYSTKATEIDKAVFGENHPEYATSLCAYANICSDSGDYLKAVEYGTKALEIIKTVLGIDHPDYALILSDLSYFYSNLGDYSKALGYSIKATEINRGVFGENNPNYAISLVNLATSYSNLGDYSKAIECGKKAVDIFKFSFGENSPNYAKLLKRISSYYFAFGNYSKALECLKECVSIEKNNILSVFSFSRAFQRNLYWNKYSADFTDVYPGLLYKSNNNETSDLYNQSALFAKGLLLSTATEMNKLILESGDDEALHMYEELRFKRMELQKWYEKPIAERYVNTDSLKTVTDQLEKELVERSKVYGDYTKKLQTTWKDVQQSLADDELAVEFLSFNVYGTDSTMVAALTLQKDNPEPKFYPLFELRQLKELSDTVTFICSDLTSLVWQPLYDELRGINTVYFSPTGVLHKIGVEYAPGMENYEMFRLSSTREIIDLKAPLRTTEESLASLYGGIDYESSNPMESAENLTASDASLKYSMSQHRAIIDSLDLRGIQIDYLPGTLREVQTIQKTLTNKHYNATVYTGAKATETSIKSLSGKDTGILHISTHGFYYTESQAKKKEKLRFLSFDDKRYANYEDKTLTRSGLLMAGAKMTIDGKDVPMDSDDGILTAQEISQLDLRGIDFVVLSACETGRGDIVQGEGVFGLQRGFKKAGVKTILMSLWRVSDVSTEILMTEFYKNLCEGKSKRESLRLAQKTVREYKDDEGNLLFQDPHYWAGFILLD